jgi:hypothetical protein
MSGDRRLLSKADIREFPSPLRGVQVACPPTVSKVGIFDEETIVANERPHQAYY